MVLPKGKVGKGQGLSFAGRGYRKIVGSAKVLEKKAA